jgi:hypothetical protein
MEAASLEKAVKYDEYVFVIRARISKLMKIRNFIMLKSSLQIIPLNERST